MNDTSKNKIKLLQKQYTALDKKRSRLKIEKEKLLIKMLTLRSQMETLFEKNTTASQASLKTKLSQTETCVKRIIEINKEINVILKDIFSNMDKFHKISIKK